MLNKYLKKKKKSSSLIIDIILLSGKCSFGENNSEFYKNLIVRIVEVLIAFHCTQDSTVSFIGMNIIKNSIFALNHILWDTQLHYEVKTTRFHFKYCLKL